MLKKLTRALLSVSDKTGLIDLGKALQQQGVDILSTGGTAAALREAGIKVTDISDHTGFPEIMGGRVKTLHPKVHGGLLGIRENKEHQQAMQAHAIQPIDLVVVNLYPFEFTVAKGADFETCIENIDIGGPSMIRSAAKNHEDVAVVVDPADYPALLSELQIKGGTTLELRRSLAAKAFARTASYDAAISNWFSKQLGEEFPASFTLPMQRKQALRYGENPHQQAALYAIPGGRGIVQAEQVQGKELSYNNLNDADAALELVAEFSEPAVAIIKHANPCGVATGKDLNEAYARALACDPVSAFGGIIALNRPLDALVAETITGMFVEVIIAPGADAAAREICAKKKNVRLLLTGSLPDASASGLVYKSLAGGMLVQERDRFRVTAEELKVVTKRAPTDQELNDMLFAFTVCKHVKSNAIVFAKEGGIVGIGAGQMSRVDSVRIATIKAAERSKGAVVASDAFFPFADGLVLAAEAGITAAIQPGGSVRDEEVIEAANQHGMAMVFTGRRHFKH